MQIAMMFAAFAAFTTWAFWKETPIPFMVAGGIGIATSLYWFVYFRNSFGLAVSLVLLAFAFYCLANAFITLFKRFMGNNEGEEE